VSFFTRHPTFWTAFWAIFAFGGAVILFGALPGAQPMGDLVRGVVGIGCGLMMIGLIRKNTRSSEAKR
jgi:lipid-A-disaccharide synthase-like uncharacterized protein